MCQISNSELWINICTGNQAEVSKIEYISERETQF